jgi:hypothetical protein
MRKLQRGACNAKKLLYLAAALALIVPSAAFTQATARLCTAVEEAGPACLLARQELASLPAGEIFWHIDRFPSKEAAAAAAIATGVVAEAFGSTWLFTLEKKGLARQRRASRCRHRPIGDADSTILRGRVPALDLPPGHDGAAAHTFRTGSVLRGRWGYVPGNTR